MPRKKAKARGAKTALCVGINNYPGTGSDLNGCVNDAKDWRAELKKRGYTVQLILDRKAKKAKIESALTSLVTSAKSGDKVVFTFSGHGSWLPDANGDEADARDEMLCPYDVMSGNYLVDDDLADIFSLKAKGVKLYFIADSCHSGTVSRFAQPFGRAEEVRRASQVRFLAPEVFLKGTELAGAQRLALARSTTRQRYPALLAAGCQDNEYSYDAYINGRFNGAFTRVALDALKTKPATPRTWMKEIRKTLPSTQYPQKPKLYGSRWRKRRAMF